MLGLYRGYIGFDRGYTERKRTVGAWAPRAILQRIETSIRQCRGAVLLCPYDTQVYRVFQGGYIPLFVELTVLGFRDLGA